MVLKILKKEKGKKKYIQKFKKLAFESIKQMGSNK